MKKMMVYLTLLVFGLLVCSVGQSAVIRDELASKLIRLHVVANSDSELDQSVKLEVRDAVVTCLQENAASCRTLSAAAEWIGENLSLLQGRAEARLTELGQSDRVTVAFTQEPFPTRHYDTFDLPSGEYRSLRVTLGAGEGHNWWCVAFPSLCFAATAEEWDDAAQTADFTGCEQALIEGGEDEYEIRFQSLEWLKDFWNWLWG